MIVYTVGHSTRSLESLLDLLEAHHIVVLADVRTVPRSRHNPQFNQDTLPDALGSHGIRYVHLPDLGGLRHGLGAASPNTGWKNKSFRGYADYMQTKEFESGLSELMSIGRDQTTAIMCAEAVPYRRIPLADDGRVQGPEHPVLAGCVRSASVLNVRSVDRIGNRIWINA